MNYKFFEILLISLLFYFFFSCTNSTATKPLDATSSNNSIRFKVNGEEVKTSGWNISRFDMGRGINLNVTTNMHQDKRTLLFNINGWTPGSYILKEGSSGSNTGYGDYKPDYTDMLTSFSFVDGLFLLESIDTGKGVLNASFYGTAKNGNQVFSITDGKIINGNLKTGITKY